MFVILVHGCYSLDFVSAAYIVEKGNQANTVGLYRGVTFENIHTFIMQPHLGGCCSI